MARFDPALSYASDLGSSGRGIIRTRAAKVGAPYNLCYETSFKLMDDLQTEGFGAQMLKCKGLLMAAPDADTRWHDLAPQNRWVHFVVRLGEEIIDLTRRQFFPTSTYPFVQSYAACQAEWTEIDVAELRSYMY